MRLIATVSDVKESIAWEPTRFVTLHGTLGFSTLRLGASGT